MPEDSSRSGWIDTAVVFDVGIVAVDGSVGEGLDDGLHYELKD